MVCSPLKIPLEEQTSIEDGCCITQRERLYTDRSKTDSGVDDAFCVMENQIITHRWSTKMQNYNSVFQTELSAIQKAIYYVTNLPQQPITILVGNQASVLAATTPKSRNLIMRTIRRNLIQFRHIQVPGMPMSL
ncbi:hypothetical protein AVEN_64143-1 [Araneus ventricosus]|uniref:RNase H type-1 domain-containing protein n=1 Tax=Araneus ventricosus TaxID=182803 RepID=A0A4Y2C749_ARAVE|nr:hypothetical protein AVEN_64143-1 [Araneus ventricosus]